MTPTRLVLPAVLTLLALPALAADPPRLDLKPGDRIAVLGNTLADRMQHDAWLDAYLHTHFPTLDLSVRHMGYSGDEVGGYGPNPDFHKRLRSAAFGSGDEWLTRVKADVVFAFFGYNESFAGKEGLDAFKKSLDAFVKHTLAQKYNGQSAPRLVLFSPISQEPPKGRDLPDPAGNNARLALYTTATAEVAAANDIPFVDLYRPSVDLFARSPHPLTVNGIHPTPDGYRELARIIDQALFGGDGTRDTGHLEKVRKAAADRNFTWYQRHRTTDGYSIYGGRADLKFVNDQTNRVVAQRELEILDVMTANRDRVVWAAAKNQDAKPDDSNTPPFIPVITNKPGAGPNGKHLFFSGEEAISKMTPGKGLQVTLFADESMFPDLVNPVQMAWDTKGRLWVAVWPTYPHWTPKGPMNDKLLILEDTNADGKADKMTVFADDLHNPTGFEFYNGGVLVAQAPDLVFLKDTDGDDRADVRERVLSGVDTADTHHTANSFVLDPGGALYFQEGTFHHSQVESPYGPPRRVANGAVFRYEPRTHKFDVYVTFGFANPHGHVFDRWGQDIVVDGTGAVPYHGPLFSGHLPYPDKHNKPPQVYQQRTRPCGGMEYVYSKHLPEEFWGNLVLTNVIGFQGLLRYKIEDSGSSLKGTELEPIVSSTDPNFRPVDVKTGPDGAIYFIDWHNPIIGHMQHNLRDPSRDKEHGRIYKITHKDRDLVKPAKIAGEPVPALLDLLKAPEDRVRYRARIELSGRDQGEVLTALKTWTGELDPNAPDFEHHRLEALWLHQARNDVNVELLKQVLGSKDFHARAAAVRVLAYWRDRVPEALALLRAAAADDAPRVRLMAVWAASFFTEPEAIEVVLIAGEKPRDQYLDFLSGETLRALNPIVQRAVAAGKEVQFSTAAGAKYFLKIVSTESLVKMKRTPEVFAELLARPGVRDEVRLEAATGLAAAGNRPAVRVLLDAFRNQDRPGADESVAFDLARLITARPADLAAARPELESIAASGTSPVLRQMAYVSLIAADGSADRAWGLAARSVGGLRDFVTAVPQIRDPNQRAALYPRLVELLSGLPKDLAAKLPKGDAVHGRYVRIELPGRQRTLTLAEVEVFSDGRNVARTGKASQSSTAHGGVASRAVDGNKSGSFGDDGQTHTREGQANPWWELDLGGEFPVDSIDVYNRTDGNLSTRLNNFTLKVLDRDRKVVFQKTRLPTPAGKASYAVGGESPERVIRRAAMLALTSVRGKETETFTTLARYVRDDADRAAAVAAIQRLPVAAWPKDQAPALLDAITAHVATVPVADRTTPAVLDAMQFAYSLAGLLPREKARAARSALGALGVRVIRVGTLTDQMLFDKERIIVEAGKPVEFVIDNTDIMPHNFVITRMGALEEVGNAAEAFGSQPGAQEKNFVPPSDKILLASRLLQPRDSQTLRFTAPSEPGVYPYVCTYPGHWRRMHGALYVVPNLDDYLEDPEKYLAAHSIPVRDELLKFNRPRTEWKFEELSPVVAELEHGGRSFSHGKQMFTVATCVACHKFDGQGQEFGPDLTQLDPKVFTAPRDVLEHVLDPSKRIEDKYRSFTFNLLSGGTLTGMVLEKTPSAYKVIENPLAKAEARTVKADDLEGDPKPSPSSIMPKGLLDKLTKDEILDLLAYVLAKGDPKHKYFQGGHDHGGHKH